METVPFFTPRGKLILNKGAMPSISGLKGLSVCVNVVSKNTKLRECLCKSGPVDFP